MGPEKVIEELTSKTIEKKLGVSIRQLQAWDKKGIINSTKKGAKNKRFYCFQDIIQVNMVKRLRDTGVSLAKIKLAVERLRRDSDLPRTPLVNLNVVSDGTGVYIIEKDGKIWNAVNGQLEAFEFEELIKETAKIISLQGRYDQLKIKDVFRKICLNRKG